MLKNLKYKIKKKIEVFSLISLIIITAISTSYFNYKKSNNQKIYNNFVDNIYFKKTLNEIINNLEPKYKKIKHKIKSGETFDKILESYSIKKEEIIKIKSSLQKKMDFNKLNTKQIIEFSLDKTTNKIEEFSFQVSSTQKINLTRNLENDNFKEEILFIKLNKKIIYKEDIILQSLYKSAESQKIPANIIIEFAEFMDFKLIFKETYERKINFKYFMNYI